MRSFPFFTVVLSILLWTGIASADGFEIKSSAGVENLEAENLDIKRVRLDFRFLQQKDFENLSRPLIFGFELEGFDQEVTNASGGRTQAQEAMETETIVVNGIIGISIGDYENGFLLRMLFAPSVQRTEAVEDKFFLAGASVSSLMDLRISRNEYTETWFYSQVKVNGRLGTDAAHASGKIRLGVRLSLRNFPLTIELGNRTTFFVQNLGVNSGLERFLTEVDVVILSAEAKLKVWIFEVSGFYSPEFAGRLTGQNQFGVTNNGPGSNWAAYLGIDISAGIFPGTNVFSDLRIQN